MKFMILNIFSIKRVGTKDYFLRIYYRCNLGTYIIKYAINYLNNDLSRKKPYQDFKLKISMNVHSLK